MSHEITTIPSLKLAIKVASTIYIRPRFGVSEAWVKITKQEAKLLADSLPEHMTPNQCEMYAGIFGTLAADCLFMG